MSEYPDSHKDGRNSQVPSPITLALAENCLDTRGAGLAVFSNTDGAGRAMHNVRCALRNASTFLEETES